MNTTSNNPFRASTIALLLANDCEPDERLDVITRDAVALFKVPIAMINLVTSDEIIFKSCVGLTQGDSLDRSGMFCSYAANQEKPLMVVDAMQHSFFKDCALVTGPLALRSYAGKSLHAPDGSKIGTLCLFDTKPRLYSPQQLEALCALAELADQQLSTLLVKNTRPSPVA